MTSSLTSLLPPQIIRLADNLILLLSRFSLAAIFWLSGQTKVEGFALNFITGTWQLGWPRIKESTFYLFEYEYALPLLSFELAAILATLAEHLFPLLLLFGLATRLAAFGLFVMTMVIQLFVYPDAYATHLTWMALSLLLMTKGAGWLSCDDWIFKRYGKQK